MARSRKLLIGCVVAVPLFCGLGGWGFWRVSDLGQAESELDQAIVDAKAAGLPWVAKDLDPVPPVKDEENAGPFVTQAIKLRKKNKTVGAALNDLEKAISDSDEAAQTAALSKLGPLIELGRKAGDMPRCDLHRDWDEGMWLLLPEYEIEKKLTKLLSALALKEAGAGQDQAALADLRRAAWIGRHADSEPTLIGMIVGVACDAITLRSAELIAEKWHGDSRRLGELRRTLSDLGPDAEMTNALRGEAYFGVSSTRNFRGLQTFAAISGDQTDWDKKFPKPKEFVRSGKPKTVFGRIFLARNLQFWTRAWKEIVPIGDPERMGQELDQWAKKEAERGWSHQMNGILFPVFAPAGQSAVKMQAVRRATRGLVAVLQFKALHGRYPRSLAEAGFKELDPFTKKPLGLIVKGETCRVYSVGPDRTDDRGVRREELTPGANTSKGWDCVASYPAYRKPKAKPMPGP
jgi:hypothetical protein